ncbi:hypothetical protein ABW21_db0202196 [Orbilia brochopaga]|nr:hypothetical protein ABW21_db0202196 [Drechslerella brochopaga]
MVTRWKLLSLYLPQNQALVPAIDERGVAPDFNLYTNKLWDRSDKTAVPAPNRVQIATALKSTVTMRMTMEGYETSEDKARREKALQESTTRSNVDEIKSLEYPGVVLKVFAETEGTGRREVASTTYRPSTTYWPDVKITHEFSANLKQLVSPSRALGEPYAFVGRLSFELMVVPEQREVYPFTPFIDEPEEYTVPIEVYAICPSMPNFLKYEGIPINLLRFALGPQNKLAGKDADTPYLTAITKRVFNSGFVYERNGGAYAYTSGAGRTFEVNKFLKIWSVVNGTASEQTKALYDVRFSRRQPTVNCYDQTGILGLCLYFACKNDADFKTLVPYFMGPFGFLHDSPLVGWDKDTQGNVVKCNNPFWTWTTDIHVNPTAPERSKFGNHVFLKFRNVIYDACAGPYIGQGDLSQYISASIDSADGTYPLRVLTGDGKDTKPVDKAKVTGGVNNATAYPPASEHGGILGELDNMMRENRWNLSTQISSKLDNDNFRLDAHNLGSFLENNAAKTNDCTITSVDGPVGETGALELDSDPTKQGEFLWAITAKWWSDIHKKWNEGFAILYWRILPDTESAVRERAGMYGGMPNGPTDASLATDEIVSAYFEQSKMSTATAVVQRNVLHLETWDFERKAMVQVLQDVLKCAAYAYQPGVQIKVTNQGAGSKNTPVQIKAEVGKVSTYIVQVQNCFDIDWSYSDGNMFLLDYDVSDKNNFKLGPNEQVSIQDGENQGFVDGITRYYRFKFYARWSGMETVKLVFYNRYYDDTSRYLEFKIGGM